MWDPMLQVDTATNNTASPYIQLLSMTDPSTAHNECVAMRLKSLNGTNSLGTNQSTGSQNGNGSGHMAEDFFGKIQHCRVLSSSCHNPYLVVTVTETTEDKTLLTPSHTHYRCSPYPSAEWCSYTPRSTSCTNFSR